MKRITRANTVFYMSGDNKPVESIESGELVVFETVDCFNGQIQSEDTKLESVKREFTNPATGPLYINEAEPGDMLRIEIIDIKTRDWGVMTVRPGEDVLGALLEEKRAKIIPIQNGEAVFNDRIRLSVEPMIGVIGVAPAEGSIRTTAPDSHGGNMDCKRIIKGAVLYLPVFVKGGLLALGDLHELMADGEAGGCGVETSGEVTLRVTVVKGEKYPLPIVVQGGCISTLASCKTLGEAAEQATVNMHHLLVENTRLDSQDAAMLISLAGELRVCQIVDPLMTCRVELPLFILEKYGCKLT
ncbi:MAG: acetamidase/formamidase family protein [Caulobacteraceae bacterium]